MNWDIVAGSLESCCNSLHVVTSCDVTVNFLSFLTSEGLILYYYFGLQGDA
jgi:hypothetical protein